MMKNISLNLNEKRFLIIWITVCFLAFSVNLAGIQGNISDDIRLFTNADSKYGNSNFEDDFWPFTTFVKDYSYSKIRDGAKGIGGGYYRESDLDFYSGTNFYGIFNSFDLLELIIYSLLGVGIIFLPKIWKESKN